MNWARLIMANITTWFQKSYADILKLLQISKHTSFIHGSEDPTSCNIVVFLKEKYDYVIYENI